MDNHEYLEQKFGKVHEGCDLEERYDYLVSQIKWMQDNWADVFHNSLTDRTRVTVYTGDGEIGTEFGYCLLHAIDNLKTKLEKTSETR